MGWTLQASEVVRCGTIDWVEVDASLYIRFAFDNVVKYQSGTTKRNNQSKVMHLWYIINKYHKTVSWRA